MLRCCLAIFLLCCSFVYSVYAQLFTLHYGVGKGSAVTYAGGPGDIVSGATIWYGLRSYSIAYATGLNKALQLRRGSDDATQDINILSTGDFDTSSAISFAGTDATCTGSMVGTNTLTISSCSSGTLKVYDVISGAGITQPAFIANIGTCASPPGTCTMSSVQTFSSETVTAQTALYVRVFYDQSGNSRDCTQATKSSQPVFISNALNGKPGIWFPGAQNCTGITIPSTTLGSYSIVYNRIQNGNYAILSMFGSGSQGELGAVNTANRVTVYSGANLNAVSNDAAFHSVNAVAGTSGVINVDGTETTGSSGAGAASTSYGFGANPNASSPFNGWIMEGGLWGGASFSSGNRTSLCHQQYTYWATAASC